MKMKCSLVASPRFSKWILVVLCIHRQEISIQKEWIIDNYFLCFAPSYNSTTNIILNEFPSSQWCFIFVTYYNLKTQQHEKSNSWENVSLIFPPIYHPLPSCSRLSAQLLGKWYILNPSTLIKMMDPSQS